MKICFDGIGISHLSGTGLYSYTYEIINNLKNIYPQADYEVVTNEGVDVLLWEKDKNVKLQYMNLNRKKNDYHLLEKYIKNNHIHIYHSVNNGFSIPKEVLCRYIISVHNVLSMKSRGYADEKYFNKFMDVFPKAIERADKIIAVSDLIKKELINEYNASKNKIEVVYPVHSKQFRPMDIEKCKHRIKEKHKIGGDYLLHVGSIHNRKNLTFLFKAFKEVLKSYRSLKLVIIGDYQGKREGYYLRLKKYARQLNIENHIIFTGLVKYSEMPYFYNGAKCVINISEYEGFPLSSVEAMACEIPVICSKISSFEEVLGPFAIFVNSRDVESLKECILEVMNNQKFRQQKLDQGILQLSKYRADSSIKKLVRAYESVL